MDPSRSLILFAIFLRIAGAGGRALAGARATAWLDDGSEKAAADLSGATGGLSWGNTLTQGLLLAGWFQIAAGGWAAAASAGAWSPLWLALLIALGVALLNRWLGLQARPWARLPLWLLADISMLMAACAISTPAVDLWAGDTSTRVAIPYLLAGSVADLVLARVPRALATAALVAPLLVRLANPLLGDNRPVIVNFFGDLFLEKPALDLGLAVRRRGQMIKLESGVVGWMERPAQAGPAPAALFFHGADRDGAMQPAAAIIRRGLVEAGFVVLSLDHPGFGRSPRVAYDAPMSAWDDLTSAVEAYGRLRAIRRTREIVVVGHSMGTTEALRLVAQAPELGLDLAGAVLFGAGPFPPSRQDEFYYVRFNADRSMPNWVDREGTLAIRRRYYNNSRAARDLPRDHLPVIFTMFHEDFVDQLGSRLRLYRSIPGRKTVWEIPSSHYFDAFVYDNFIFGGTAPTRIVARLFEGVLEQLRDLAASPLSESSSQPSPSPVRPEGSESGDPEAGSGAAGSAEHAE